MLGTFTHADGYWGMYVYKCGLRGDVPDLEVEVIPEEAGSPNIGAIDNPAPGDPPTIVFTVPNFGIAEYTRGGTVNVTPPSEDLRLWSPTISPNGVIVSGVQAWVQVKKRSGYWEPRLQRDFGGTPEQLSGYPGVGIECKGVNDNGTTIVIDGAESPATPAYIYHDDWGWIDLLAISATSNSLMNYSTNVASRLCVNNTDTLGFSQIAAAADNAVTGEKELVILTPVEITP